MVPIVESFLEEIYQLSLENHQIFMADICSRLGISLPMGIRMLRKLVKDKYIEYKRPGVIVLTEEGKRLGDILVKRNSILQEFLFLINESADITQEAKALEGNLSPATILAIEKLVSFMKEDKKMMEGFSRFCDEGTHKEIKGHEG